MQQYGNNPAPYHQQPVQSYPAAQQPLTDPLLEQDLHMSGEAPVWRGSGKPSAKQMAGPLILVLVGFAIMFIMVAASPAPAEAMIAVSVAAAVFISIVLAFTFSAVNTQFFVAVTPTRVVCVRRGAWCGPVITVVPLAEMIQIRCNEAPPGYCCAPGPMLLIDTPASLIRSAQLGFSDDDGSRRTRDEPALSVALMNPMTIHEMRRAIETARSAIMGLPPLSVVSGTTAVTQPQSTAYVPQATDVVVYQPVMVPSYGTTAAVATPTPMAVAVPVAAAGGGNTTQYAPVPQVVVVPNPSATAPPPYGAGAEGVISYQ